MAMVWQTRTRCWASPLTSTVLLLLVAVSWAGMGVMAQDAKYNNDTGEITCDRKIRAHCASHRTGNDKSM